MKIAILSSASAGGAGIAAFRNYTALAECNSLDVDFFDIEACGQVSPSISPSISASNGKISNTHFTIDHAGEAREWLVDLLSEYDAINIQWASYLISLSEILALARLGKRILFTLHDFHYITGGCHYPAGCLGYYETCIGCAQVDEKVLNQRAVIRTNKLKREIFSYSNVHLSAPSAFLVKEAVEAGMVPVERAHLLRNTYTPVQEFEPRNASSTPSILLIADSFDEERKGLSLAIDALKTAARRLKQIDAGFSLHLVGRLDIQVISRLDGSGIQVVSHGHIKDHRELVKIFQGCDFVLSCSYEDNWPNILVESACYGCIPIVGKWHGCEEFVDTFNMGHKSENYSEQAFAKAIMSAALTYGSESEGAIADYVSSVRSTHAPWQVKTSYLEVLQSIDKEGNQSRLIPDHNFRKSIVSKNHLLGRLGSITSGDTGSGEEILLQQIEKPFGPQKFTSKRVLLTPELKNIELLDQIDSTVHDEKHNYGLANFNLESPKGDHNR